MLHPKDKSIIGTKWVFKNKKDEDGVVIRNKARLVGKGNNQEEGVECDETFAPLARIEAIQMFLAYMTRKNFTVYQMEVKTAIRYGVLKKIVYCLATRWIRERLKTRSRIHLGQSSLWSETSCTCLTPMKPGSKLNFDPNGISIDPKTYRGMLGSLMYLTTSRPYIMISTCFCARFQAKPKESHLLAAKRILRYLKGRTDLGLWYPKETGYELTAYFDVDHVGCKLDRESTSGHVQFMGD
ncbi:uncharacterized protein LOC112523741 [Cynara cardunculus var. scolymus]|uniref:uncharacterized protein LOC112523741 n=1 Tax=Cynara cardunculus var. scolymus TaxID=59895 RepID=UPI000D628798|nr:uncharacterized protein LOC112523741 [Cynara cardunculus var. scolymus]